MLKQEGLSLKKRSIRYVESLLAIEYQLGPLSRDDMHAAKANA